MRYRSFSPFGILIPALVKRTGARGMTPSRCLAGMFLMSNLDGDLGIFKPREGRKADEADGRRCRRREAITAVRGGEAMTASVAATHLFG